MNPVIPALNPGSTRLYVPNLNSDSVSVIDTSSDTVVATIAVPSAAVASFDRTGTRLYVSSIGGAVSPALGAMTPSGARLYVNDIGNGAVYVIDTATNTVVATIALPGDHDDRVLRSRRGRCPSTRPGCSPRWRCCSSPRPRAARGSGCARAALPIPR